MTALVCCGAGLTSPSPKIEPAPGAGPVFRRWLLAFLVIDLLLIADNVVLAVLSKLGVIDGVPQAFKVAGDRSVPESFNYVKWTISAFMLLLTWRGTGRVLYLALAAVFAVMLADDLLMIHEQVGAILSGWTTIRLGPGLRTQDTGELAVFGIIAAICVMILAVPFRRSDGPDRWFATRYAMIFAALVVVAVLMDAVHQAVAGWMTGPLTPYADFALALAEDGGEMFVASAAAALSIAAYRATCPSEPASGSAIRP